MIKDWDFIITDKFEVETQVMSLPKFIKIKNVKPGEPRYMRLRAARVVRLHKFSREKTPHEYYFSELQLYMPFEKEEELEPQSLEKCKEKYDQISHNGKRKVFNVKSVLMEHLESVEDGTEKAQEMLSTCVGDTLDPAKEQEDDDCEEEGIHDYPEFMVKDPGEYNKIENVKKGNIYKIIELYSDDKIEEITRNLDEEQRLVLDIAVAYAKSILKSRKTHQFSQPPLLIIQGGAGSGKSTLIDTVCQQIEKILRKSGDDPNHPYCLKVAYTGTAAANIKGQTLHNAFSFNFGNTF